MAQFTLPLIIRVASIASVSLAALLLAACSEPAPTPPEATSAVLQGNQLRYAAGNPQLALLTVVDVKPSTAVTSICLRD